MTRTITTFRATALPRDTWLRRQFGSLKTRFLRMQSGQFEGLAEYLYARDKLGQAADHDDLESAYERRGFSELDFALVELGSSASAGARRAELYIRRAARYFRLADRADRQERHEGWESAGQHIDQGAAYFRGVSTEIEAGRLAVLHAARWGGKGGDAA